MRLYGDRVVKPKEGFYFSISLKKGEQNIVRQYNFLYPGHPCDILNVDGVPFFVTNLYTLDGDWFSISLECTLIKNKDNKDTKH